MHRTYNEGRWEYEKNKNNDYCSVLYYVAFCNNCFWCNYICAGHSAYGRQLHGSFSINFIVRKHGKGKRYNNREAWTDDKNIYKSLSAAV